MLCAVWDDVIECIVLANFACKLQTSSAGVQLIRAKSISTYTSLSCSPALTSWNFKDVADSHQLSLHYDSAISSDYYCRPLPNIISPCSTTVLSPDLSARLSIPLPAPLPGFLSGWLSAQLSVPLSHTPLYSCPQNVDLPTVTFTLSTWLKTIIRCQTSRLDCRSEVTVVAM
jgi:hypothetical protein